MTLHDLSFAYTLPDRSYIKATGKDTRALLQGLLTQDMRILDHKPSLYGWIVNAKGRFLHDVVVYAHQSTEGDVLIECSATHQDALLKLLNMYKLRRDVVLEKMPQLCTMVSCKETHTDDNAIKPILSAPDPRLPHVWQRHVMDIAQYSKPPSAQNEQRYHLSRITHGVFDSDVDLVSERSFPLEVNLEKLHGLSFSKGCYMGQEPIARAHYQGIIRKRLIAFKSDAPLPPPGSSIDTNFEYYTAEECASHARSLGTLYSSVSYEGHHVGLGLIRLDEHGNVPQSLRCGACTLTPITT